MTTFENAAALNDETRTALVDLLYRLADDEIVLGHRDSEWTGLGPILEADIAFSSIAQDEMGHALMFYQLLEQLGEKDPDTLAFARAANDYRCSQFVALDNEDWAFSVIRQFLYDAAESVRLGDLTHSAYLPLAQVARKIASEEKYHLMHGRTWVTRLGSATDDSHRRMQEALDKAWPYALGLFEPTEADEVLATAGLCPHEGDLCRRWEETVRPVLAEAKMTLPTGATPAYGGRRGQQPPALGKLLESMQLVYNSDPDAKW